MSIPFEEIIRGQSSKFTGIRASKDIRFGQECLFALQAFERNNRLKQCTEESVRSAILDVAAVGLSLNPALKHAYLIPRSRKVGKDVAGKPIYIKECCLDISYLGMKHAAEQSGAVITAWANVVWSNDEYEHEEGSEPRLYHKPTKLGENRGVRVAAYAIAELHNGRKHITVLRSERIEEIRQCSENPDGTYSPWVNHTDEMWRKTAMKNGAKYWPHVKQFAEVISVANKTEGLRTEYLEQQERRRGQAKELPPPTGPSDEVRSKVHDETLEHLQAHDAVNMKKLWDAFDADNQAKLWKMFTSAQRGAITKLIKSGKEKTA